MPFFPFILLYGMHSTTFEICVCVLRSQRNAHKHTHRIHILNGRQTGTNARAKGKPEKTRMENEASEEKDNHPANITVKRKEEAGKKASEPRTKIVE